MRSLCWTLNLWLGVWITLCITIGGEGSVAVAAGRVLHRLRKLLQVPDTAARSTAARPGRCRGEWPHIAASDVCRELAVTTHR